ncbi:phage gp30.7 domain-containing protein [Rhizoctonia solani AG-1 IA]|uniref:Phage gp30.7 domain-containing protein n=1 Tax=Thanatephorus cucumeris (strain AG1-IA) TaxID=983506 RepID=L8X868_THACA|nr:phage gp30.7 domain-containing protein [Rhizoctonia solani AG-1 IA]
MLDLRLNAEPISGPNLTADVQIYFMLACADLLLRFAVWFQLDGSTFAIARDDLYAARNAGQKSCWVCWSASQLHMLSGGSVVTASGLS